MRSGAINTSFGLASIVALKFADIWSGHETGRVLSPITPTVVARPRALGLPIGATRAKKDKQRPGQDTSFTLAARCRYHRTRMSISASWLLA